LSSNIGGQFFSEGEKLIGDPGYLGAAPWVDTAPSDMAIKKDPIIKTIALSMRSHRILIEYVIGMVKGELATGWVLGRSYISKRQRSCSHCHFALLANCNNGW
jgi:hypothetical protein